MDTEKEGTVYTLTYEDVVDILHLIDGSSCQEFHLALNDLRLDVIRGRRDAPVSASGTVPAPAPAETSRASIERAPRTAIPEDGGTAGKEPAPSPGTGGQAAPVSGFPLQSPLGGTFYRAPAPDARPFVEVGDTVEPGDQVAIVEVMKLMNSIKAPLKGTVLAILVDNETVVTMGQTLMIIDPA